MTLLARRLSPCFLLFLLAGCGDSAPSPGAGAADESAWVELFDGESLSGWTPKIKGHEAGDDPKQIFRVEDGAIAVSYEGYDEFEGRFGHLFCDREFENYDLELEYRFTGEQTPGGPGWAWRNSGAMIQGQSLASMRKDQDFPVSIEVQFLGGPVEGERPTGNLCTPGTHVVFDGELLRRHVTNSSSKTYRGDGWVRVRIEVRPEVIRHFVEDELVLSYSSPQLDPGDATAAALAAERGGELALKGGSISLQAESHPCAFRRIRLRPWSEADAPK
jgi:3-keto-disaccharide hydrolase